VQHHLSIGQKDVLQSLPGLQRKGHSVLMDGAHVNATWQDGAPGARKQLAKATPLLGRGTVAWPRDPKICPQNLS
jgi:hypothetical protein